MSQDRIIKFIKVDELISNNRFITPQSIERRKLFNTSILPEIEKSTNSVGISEIGVVFNASVANGLADDKSDTDATIFIDGRVRDLPQVARLLNRSLRSSKMHLNFRPISNVLRPGNTKNTRGWAFQAKDLFAPPIGVPALDDQIHTWRKELVDMVRNESNGQELWEAVRQTHALHLIFREKEGQKQEKRIEKALASQLKCRGVDESKLSKALRIFRGLRSQATLPSFDELKKLK